MRRWPYYKHKAKALARELGHRLGYFKVAGPNLQWAVCHRCKLKAIIKKDTGHFRHYTGMALVSRCTKQPLQFRFKDSRILEEL